MKTFTKTFGNGDTIEITVEETNHVCHINGEKVRLEMTKVAKNDRGITAAINNKYGVNREEEKAIDAIINAASEARSEAYVETDKDRELKAYYESDAKIKKAMNI